MPDRDPVEVEADALADRLSKIVRPWLIEPFCEITENDLEVLSAFHRSAGRIIATALRTAQARGAEGMREAVIGWHREQIATIRGADLDPEVPVTGWNEIEVHEEAIEAVRALPVSDAPASPWPKVKKLPWGAPYENDDGAIAYSAVTSIGRFIACTNGWFIQGLTTWNDAITLDAAKAAAQADYERRIISALEISLPEAQ